MRRELAKRVRAELEVRIEQQWIPVEESLKAQLAEISKDVTLKLLDEFKTLRGHSSQDPGVPDRNKRKEQEEALEVSNGCHTPGSPVASSSFTKFAQDDYPTAPPTQGMTTEAAMDSSAAGDQAFDTLTMSQGYFEDAHWAEPGISLVDSHPISWSSIFPNPGDIQLGTAAKALPTATLPMDDGRNILMGDGTILGTDISYQQLSRLDQGSLWMMRQD